MQPLIEEASSNCIQGVNLPPSGTHAPYDGITES